MTVKQGTLTKDTTRKSIYKTDSRDNSFFIKIRLHYYGYQFKSNLPLLVNSIDHFNNKIIIKQY